MCVCVCVFISATLYTVGVSILANCSLYMTQRGEKRETKSYQLKTERELFDNSLVLPFAYLCLRI